MIPVFAPLAGVLMIVWFIYKIIEAAVTAGQPKKKDTEAGRSERPRP